MRLFFGVLVCIGSGAISVALADDPPSAPDTATSPTASASSPTQTPSAAPANAAKAVNTDAAVKADDSVGQERHFLSEGYKIEMRNGEKMYCRREEQMGSRLGGQKNCSTPQQLTANETQAKELVERNQRQMARGPVGN
jgi:hypothetical protein